MKRIIVLMALVFGPLANAEGYHKWEAWPGGVVEGYAGRTIEVSENIGAVVEDLKERADANGAIKCQKTGFPQTTAISEYRIIETAHGNFANLVTITVSAEYGCGLIDDSADCIGRPGGYRYCQ
jgi:hypothetical protein